MEKYQYFLPLILPLMLILSFVKEIYSDIKSRKVVGIIIESLILLFTISLSILYINLISNNEYEIGLSNIWIKILLLLILITIILPLFLSIK